MFSKIQKKWALLASALLLSGFISATSSAKEAGEDTFLFDPQWQAGDSATYEVDTTFTVEFKEYPEFSGTWVQGKQDHSFQIQKAAKNRITFDEQSKNVHLDFPKSNLLAQNLKIEPKKFELFDSKLENLASTLRLSYDINSNGRITKYHNQNELVGFVRTYLDIVEEVAGQKSTQRGDLEKSITDTFNVPKEGTQKSGPFDTVFYRKSLLLNEIEEHEMLIPLPKNKESGAKAIDLSIPYTLTTEETPQGIRISQDFKLNNDDFYNLFVQVARWSDPQTADQTIQQWQMLKAIGVTVDSNAAAKTTYLFEAEEKWPKEMLTAYQGEINMNIKPLKAFLPQLAIYPDTLHLKVKYHATSKLKESVDTAETKEK